MTSRPGRPRRRSDRGRGAIAILGAACRLPGAPDPDAFWTLLAEGRDAVTTVPPERFTGAAFLHPRRGEPGKTYTFAAGTLGDVAGFDAAAFGISPREAVEMDPQQRLLLELAREAMEDAGVPPSALAGTGTGVFVGASLTDYGDLRQADPASGDRWFMTGGALSILANRIGNVFDLRGPAQTIDTACSSGLVALHLAAEALRAGRLPAAIVGGVNMLLSPFPFLGFAKAGMLSPTGRCRAFDAAADGYVRAEGGVVLVLKRLEDALAAGDAVRAVILGTASNAAGRTVGLSLPSGAAQQALIESALAEAGVAPERLSYFEAHGTGTAAGDPIEAAAIGGAIGRARLAAGAGALPIGSAKSNIGHTEPASGLVGLLKGVLALEHGRVPPTLHVSRPNPAIDFAGLGLCLATATEPLPAEPRAVIGVNSFGFGGTNACALLAAPPRPARRAEPSCRALPPLLLSAHSAESLAGLAARWRDRLAATPLR
ncbi:MAG: polyketide synthase, partial [Acetobacteraceae bacterium]|nr:polyketide synthase [Acetobacteraceae bacterium]